MALLKEINNKTATVAWSPLASNPNLIAVGTKDSGSLGFDDHGGELELHSLDFGSSRNVSTDCIASTKTISRFASLAWSRMASFTDAFQSGLIAGGMVDGTVQVWDAEKLRNGEESLVSSIEKHTGVVNGVQFNPHVESSHLLATGGSDSAVYVMNLDRPDSPNVFTPASNPNSLRHTAEVSKVAWNTQVSHILASASSNGSTIIWDLRQKRHWCELRDTQRESISDIAWNPTEGLHLVTASCDDHNPVIKLWDLRSSTTLPLATLSHGQGVLSVSWCPKDPGLLISCGKDNKTILWDLYSLKPIFELKTAENPFQTQSQIFGGLAQTVGRRYFVDWSPQLPGVIASCSFERKVQIHSLIGGSSRSNRAPKWFQKPCGASFGFGGKLVTFSKTNKHLVEIKSITEHPELIKASEKFENAIASRDFKSFCASKAQSAKNLQDQQEWGFMKIIFEKNAREQLLQYIGFDSNQIADECTNFAQSKADETQTTPFIPNKSSPQPVQKIEDFFGSPSNPADENDFDENTKTEFIEKEPTLLTEEKKEFLEEWKPVQKVTSKCEDMIKKALLVGNFEAAVDCCLSVGLYADALVLASFGGTELWMKTQNSYFEQQLPKRPLLKTIHGIINSELHKLVTDSNLLKWRETLAILSTYANSQEFSPLCELLGERLELELGEKDSAVLCYIIALNIPKTVRFWISSLQSANEKLGRVDIEALQEFVEKVTIFGQAEPDMDLGEEVIKFFRQYAELLASQGQIQTAIKYLKNNDSECAILIDRLSKIPFISASTVANSGLETKSIVTPSPSSFSDNQQFVQPQLNQQSHQPIQSHQTQQSYQPIQSQVHQPQTYQTQQIQPPQQQQQQQQQVLPSLPSGWIEMFDPNSNLPYYACPATGVTQWERPVDSNASYQPQQQFNEQQYHHQQQIIQDMNTSSRIEPTTFTPGSMTPQLTSVNYPKTETANFSTPTTTTDTAFDHRHNLPENNLHDQMNQLSLNNVGQENIHIVTVINELITNINSSALNPSEKKQLIDTQKSLSVLFEKLNEHSIAPDVLLQVSNLVLSIEQKNFPQANAIQGELAKTVWNEHKVWLKGIKYLIQLAMKKY